MGSLNSPRDIYRAGNRRLGTLLLVFGVLALLRAGTRLTLSDPSPVTIPRPIDAVLGSVLAVTLILTGLALRRGYPWARWTALVWWLLLACQVAMAVGFAGAANVHPLGIGITAALLLVVGFVVRQIWKHGPHVTG